MKHLVFSKIIVPPGKSTVDDIIACALALGANESVRRYDSENRIFRKEPSVDELDDPAVLCINVGGEHLPARGNLNYRAMDDRGQNICSYRLVAREIGVDEELLNLYPWYDTWAQISVRGPVRWAKARGLKWKPCSALVGPLVELIHREFEEANGDKPVGYPLEQWLYEFGKGLLESIDEFNSLYENAGANVALYQLHGVWVLDLTWADADKAAKYEEAMACKMEVENKLCEISVVVSANCPGSGYVLRRRCYGSADPVVNFDQCKGRDYCRCVDGDVLITGPDVPRSRLIEIIRDAIPRSGSTDAGVS